VDPRKETFDLASSLPMDPIDWFGGSAASKEQNKSFPFFIFEEVAQGYLQCTSSNIEQCQMSPLTFCMYYLA
jgi:hypothetical protein